MKVLEINNGKSVFLIEQGHVVPQELSRDDLLYILNKIYENETECIEIPKTEIIEEIKNPIEKILKIRGVTFDWKDGRNKKIKDIGVIAQEVEKVFPSVVHVDAKGFKSVDYGSLVSPLIEAVKELNKRFTSFYGEFKRIIARVIKLEVEKADLVHVKKLEMDSADKFKKLEIENAKLKAENAEFKKRFEKIEKLLEKKK